VSFAMTRGELDISRESRLRQLKHALVQKNIVALQRRKNAEDVFGCDASVGNLTREENTLPKKCIGVDVEVFLVLGMASSGLNKHNLVSDEGKSERPVGEHNDKIYKEEEKSGWV